MISAGRLRHVATVKRASTSVDSLGRRSTTYTTAGEIRVDMRQSQGNEQVYADGVAVVAATELRCRWPDIGRLSVTAIDRLECRGKTLRIVSINNLDNRDRVAVIDAMEVE
jgi:head-tail adaptor